MSLGGHKRPMLAVHSAEGLKGAGTAHDRQIPKICGDRRGRTTVRKTAAEVSHQLADSPSALAEDRPHDGIVACSSLGMKPSLQAPNLHLSVVVARGIHDSRLSMHRTSDQGASAGAGHRRAARRAPQDLNGRGTIPPDRDRFRPTSIRLRGSEQVGAALRMLPSIVSERT
jgi:hypothetical protein